MEDNLKITRKHIVILLLASLLFVFSHNLEIALYIKDVIIPFTLLILAYLIIFKDEEKLNKRAYLFLIPLGLILISGLILKLDETNMLFNILLIPLLISIFFFSLINSNYKISLRTSLWLFKLFPKDLLENLSFLKIKETKEKNNHLGSIILGVVVGTIIGLIIILLLMSADAYFKSFISSLFQPLNINFSSIVLMIISFTILFSVLINLFLNRETEVQEKDYTKLDQAMVITVLAIINTIFVLFLISEISRLTVNFLKLPIEYTYASYAREGFFQLLFVTMINFIIIMYLLYKTKSANESSKIKKLIFILITFSIILIFNSYYRMYLYINNYGFTVLRLQVILFLTMELIIFSVLIKKLFKGLKSNDALIYFIVMISFYILNLYLCNDTFINFLT